SLFHISPSNLARSYFRHHAPVAEHRPQWMLEGSRVVVGEQKVARPSKPVEDYRGQGEQPPDLGGDHGRQQGKLRGKPEGVHAATPGVRVKGQIMRVELSERHAGINAFEFFITSIHFLTRTGNAGRFSSLGGLFSKSFITISMAFSSCGSLPAMMSAG